MLATGALLLVGASARAVEVYRWVDEAGRTHLSDTVPEKYKAQATRIDSRQFEVGAPERARAEAEAADEKARAASGLAAPPARGAEPASAARPAASQASAPLSRAARQAAFEKLDCTTQWRLYRESLECFAPYIRQDPYFVAPEAFDRCTELVNPSAQCGTPSGP